MQFKIILVPFPFDGLSGKKVRSALCLTEEISHYNHVVIAFITSQISKAWESSDIILSSTDSDFKHTGLKVDSAIRLHRLVTIPEKIMLRELGKLPSNQEIAVKDKLRQLFKL
ncbi:MAG: type II toxin-antitoxin system PemK/MazF family toxin [Lewinellaceae bacterium]|nr:type II toxin-antitoxin system PemK/MazF family toxin [Phaeodactylibacter sp.]MCB9036063.1 type II toxin-antitoxin system PemK/MazF family toxin [Lewinellaceae bacterium]